MLDVMIIGGSAAGISCALVLGSAQQKEYAQNKRIGILTHQKTSHLQNALFNNVLGLAPETTGKEILETGPQQLASLYPHVRQITSEKAISVFGEEGFFVITTNKNQYKAKKLVLAVGYSKFFNIKGLEEYVMPHSRCEKIKERIQLKNQDHLVKPGLYVAGTLAGWRSQFAIACGSGAHVATDILTDWNKGKHTKIHDKV